MGDLTWEKYLAQCYTSLIGPYYSLSVFLVLFQFSLSLSSLSVFSSFLVMIMLIWQDFQDQVRLSINHKVIYDVYTYHYYYSERNILSRLARDQEYWLDYLSTLVPGRRPRAVHLTPEANEGDITRQC